MRSRRSGRLSRSLRPRPRPASARATQRASTSRSPHRTKPFTFHVSRFTLPRLQLRKLQSLLSSLIPANPFYTRKLGSHDSITTLDQFQRDIPFTTKQEIILDQQAHPPYGTNLTYPLEKYTRCHQTSGTTTTPIRWLDTPESWAHFVATWRQILTAAGVQCQDRFFFAFSFGPFLGFWSALDAVAALGCFRFPGGAMSSIARLQAILDNRITILCCTPTYALHLGEIAREQKLDLTSSCVRLIIVAGEAGGSIPATRSRIESLWPGAFVFDHHGMTEVGPVTYQCPAQPGVLHVIESSYLPEVINPQSGAFVSSSSSFSLARRSFSEGGSSSSKIKNQDPNSSSQTGELVLTTLDRIGSPLLRYRTGDLVRPRPRGVCACGSHELALEGGILGRTDDMLVVRGVNVYPSLIEEIVRSCPGIAEYRVQLDSRPSLPELIIEIEPAPGPAESSLPRHLEKALQSSLHLRIPVRLLPQGSLPRFEMKAQRWVKVCPASSS
ncbi:MAG: phenylacetate--CoA ligase [Verrucomicrobia bacterium]|nr:MAG: phenylacetate--CoA ligase [Verrucomicrobiota bacterium]